MDFKIISSNIRFDDPSDNEYQWKYRKPVLVECFKEFVPDLVATQEGRHQQLMDLSDELHPLVLADSHRSWIQKRMYPCFFYNPDSIEVFESGDIWLSETPKIPGSFSFGSTFPRLCTWIFANWKKQYIPFFAINTHLDHQEPFAREKQITVLLNEIQKVKPLDTLILLMGDFNEPPGKTVYQKLQSASIPWRDPWIEHDKREEGSSHNFKGEIKNKHRIDWLWVDKNFQCQNIFFDKFSRNGLYPSDHFPLKTILSL